MSEFVSMRFQTDLSDNCSIDQEIGYPDIGEYDYPFPIGRTVHEAMKKRSTVNAQHETFGLDKWLGCEQMI